MATRTLTVSVYETDGTRYTEVTAPTATVQYGTAAAAPVTMTKRGNGWSVPVDDILDGLILWGGAGITDGDLTFTKMPAELATIDAQTSQLVFTDGKVDANAEATVDAEALAAAIIAELPPVEDGQTITPATLDTDGAVLGVAMPYGEITVYLNDVAQYQFTADADGDYSYVLPYGSVWRLVARHDGYLDATAEVSTVEEVS